MWVFREYIDPPNLNNINLTKLWLIILVISINIVGLFLAKKVLAPQVVRAQTLSSISKVSTVAEPMSQIASSTFERIAYCESMGSSTAQNTTSTASGKYQFLDSTWAYYGKQLWGDQLPLHNKLNAMDSTILAAFVYGKNGTVDWTASQFCWDK
jgi:hypothetical protein